MSLGPDLSVRAEDQLGGDSQQVLVVEDDEGIALVLQMALEDAGFAVISVGTGEAGMLAAAEQPVDAALVDLRLPGVDRLEVIPTRAGSGMPIIVMSALAGGRNCLRAWSAGLMTT